MLTDYYDTMASKEGINVVLNTPFTRELAKEIKPFAVFVAAGADARELLGGVSRNALIRELDGIVDRIIPVGDAKKPGRVANAVHTAYEQAYIFDPED